MDNGGGRSFVQGVEAWKGKENFCLKGWRWQPEHSFRAKSCQMCIYGAGGNSSDQGVFLGQ